MLLNTGIFCAIILLTFLVAHLSNRFFTKLIRRSTDILKNDPTNYQFLRHVVSGVIYLMGFGIAVYNVPQLQALANTMLAGAGVLAVAVGFASQQALGNIISGVFVVIFKPFRIGDRLKIRELTGIVEDITLRHTVLRDLENKRIVIPNSLISNEIIVNSNFVEDKICKWIDFGISYDSSIDLAKSIIREETTNHPLYLDPRTPEQVENGDPLVNVRVIALAESSVNLRVWGWAAGTPDAFVLSCDLMESIKKRFDKEGVSIPFPHRTLVHKDTKPSQN